MSVNGDVLEWLLDSDPALRWQVERDLAHAPREVWAATRSRVPREGFGARLLAAQDADGQWAGGAHFPSDFGREEFETQPQPWTATSWSLSSLREWGVPADALGDTAVRLAKNCRWEYDDLPFWNGEVDVCINALTLSSGLWLGLDVSANAQWFVDHEAAEGGWNCEWVEGSTRASFHSTLNALFAVLDYEQQTGGTEALRAVRHRAEEYLLERRLTERLSTGEHAGDWVTNFTYPFRWRYSALRATDYFRAASLHDGVGPDARVAHAIQLVRAERQPDGRWLQGDPYRGRVWFEVDVPAGEPSKWLTFYGSRVLAWYDGVASAPHPSALSA